ncbi:MAG: flagellar hook protein FlgE [Enterobacteriaceae bacterium]|jgi:flagellar hook protein FlgE|nr:flagellar hook protein FlgE [Enterobacteriaceae bacterium]
MAFSQAVSGLNAAASNLDTIGNNIANSATFGFKSSTTAFADVFSGSDVGLGVKVSGVMQNFKDGSTTNTNRQLDMAITQGGFFRMLDDSGNVFYSRNGQFKMDADRNLINMQGMKLTGYPAVNGEVQQGGAVVPLAVPTTMLDAKATTKITMPTNLNSMESAIADPAKFDPNKKDTFNYSVPVNAFDSLGNQHNLELFFVKTADNAWTVNARDTSVTGSAHQEIGKLAFDTSGKMTAEANFAFTLPSLNGSAATALTIDLNGSKQQSLAQSSANSIKQDGYAAGQFVNYRVEDDGKVYGVYSNEEKRVLGQVVLANFSNPEGLAAQGDNVWAESGSSGAPVVGIAGTGNLGKLISGALEASNVDMSQELVNMIVAQRNYQSNAQTIKTQDQILQTLVSMR